ncbi:MAG: HNH endonuclease signature motif containing protein [Anaerolineae bacterium]
MPRVRLSSDVQRIVIERAQGRCEYCQSRADYATETFAVEHITPLSRGGTNDLVNLALACSGCNGRKYNKTEAQDPTDGKTVAIFDPRHQQWQEHFSWSEDYTHVVGLTPTGRATVEALQLNRPGLVNMRAALYAISRHPPKLNNE